MVTVALQVLLVESVVGTVAGTTGLRPAEWLASVGVSALALPVGASGKLAWWHVFSREDKS